MYISLKILNNINNYKIIYYLFRVCLVFDDHNCEHVVQLLFLFLYHVVDVDLQLIDYQVLLLRDQLQF